MVKHSLHIVKSNMRLTPASRMPFIRRYVDLELVGRQFSPAMISIINPSRQLRSDAIATIQSEDLSDSDLKGGRRLKTMADMPYGASRFTIFLDWIRNRGVLNKSILKIYTDSVRISGKIFKGSSSTSIYLADPLEAAKLFIGEPAYPFRPEFHLLKSFQKKNPHVKPGVFFSNGHDWYVHKRPLSKRLLKPLEINRYIPRLQDISNDLVCKLEKIRLPSGHEREYEVDHLHGEVHKWAFESVTDVLFDKRFGALTDNSPPDALEFFNAVNSFLEALADGTFIPPVMFKFFESQASKRVTKAYLTLNSLAEKLVKEQLNDKATDYEGKHMDKLIPYLLRSGEVTEQNIVSSVNDTLFAGIDTTTNLVQWALYLLSKNKPQQRILREEIKTAVSNGSMIDADVINLMPYLRAVIKETLRMYPALVVTGRKIQSDMVIADYHIPKGTTVNLMHWVMSRSEENFAEPEAFKPERWMRTENKEDFPLYASIPFGHGLRMCVGRRLAILETSILLSKILLKFHLDYPDNEHVEPYVRAVLIPDRALRIKFLEDKMPSEAGAAI